MSIDLDKMPADERNQLLVEVFKWIQGQGGFLPPEVYWERLKTFPTVYSEVVNFAPSDDGRDWEVLLDMRSPGDPFYANMYGTQGSTVMMRQGVEDLFARHVENESLLPFASIGDFRLCGLAVAPWTRRDHAYVPVFSRILPIKPHKYQGTWMPVSQLGDSPVIDSCRAYLEMAVAVTLRGAQPYYKEFGGTDI